MHIDCTNARVNWESAHVFVNATPDGKVYYSASTKKGHAGVEGTPAENYQGILVHDHELTFIIMALTIRNVLLMSFVI